MRRKVYNTLTSKERNGFLFVDLIVSFFVSFIIYSFLKTFIDHYVYTQILSAQQDLSTSGVPTEDIDGNALNSFLYEICEWIALFFIWTIYISISSFFTGYTVGSHMFNVKLIDYNTEDNATLLQRAIRGGVTVIDCVFLLGLGSVYALFNEERRTLADKIAKTKVATLTYIKVNKKKKSPTKTTL